MRRLQMLRRLLGVAVIMAGLVTAASAQSKPLDKIHIFFSAGCADCWPYAEKTLLPALKNGGFTAEPVIHDFTRPGGRQLLAEQTKAVGLPRRIADSLYAFAPRPDGGLLVVLGHVPGPLLNELLKRQGLPRKLVIQQPKMHGDPEEYLLWSFTGEVQSFPINAPLNTALLTLPPTPSQTLLDPGDANLATLLPAFLFTIRKSRGQILGLGAIYVAVIFVVYMTIGLGILSTVRLSEEPHFVARVGSYFLIWLCI